MLEKLHVQVQLVPASRCLEKEGKSGPELGGIESRHFCKRLHNKCLITCHSNQNASLDPISYSLICGLKS